MTNPEHSDHQKHWQELAQQLGLPVETEESRAPVSAPPPRATSGNVSMVPPDAGIVSRGARESEIRDQERPSRQASETNTPTGDVEPADAPRLASSTREERKPQERKPASGSRKEGRGQDRERSGRGRREPSARDSSTGEGATSELALEAGEVSHRGAGEKKRGGRGKGRSNVANPDTRTGEALPHEPHSPAASTTETDESDEVDNLTDWNVPSWTELIESLYRPER
jgi:hypothetical protein